jgi:ketopantoate reductase
VCRRWRPHSTPKGTSSTSPCAETEQIYGDLVLRAHRLGLTVPLLDLVATHLRLHQNRIEGARLT